MNWPSERLTGIILNIPCTIECASLEEMRSLRWALYYKLRKEHIDNVRLSYDGSKLRVYRVTEPDISIIKETP